MGTLIYLLHIKNKSPAETRISAIQTLVLSIINYCSNIWDTTNKGQILELQNFAEGLARGNVNKYNQITPQIKKLSWVKEQNKCSYGIFILIHKIIRGFYPKRP